MTNVPNTKPQTILDDLNTKAFQATLMRLNPNINLPQKLQYLANYIRDNPKLLQADRQTLKGCILQAERFNLNIGGSKPQAHIVVYGNRCQLIIGYIGMLVLAYRAGIGTVEAGICYENDTFELQYGLTKKLSVTPCFTNRGNPLFVWTMAKVNGQDQFIHMGMDEIAKVKAYSKSSNSPDSPWVKNTEEMWKKSAIIRFLKLLPYDENTNAVHDAIALSDQGEAGTQNFENMTDVTPTVSTQRDDNVESTGTEPYVPEVTTTASKILEQMAG